MTLKETNLAQTYSGLASSRIGSQQSEKSAGDGYKCLLVQEDTSTDTEGLGDDERHKLRKMFLQIAFWGVTVLIISLITGALIILIASHGSNSTSEKARMRPPQSAKFLLECEIPHGSHNRYGISDLCWLDEATLIATQEFSAQVIRFNIDFNNKTCSYSVIDSGYNTSSVSCSPAGEAHVVYNNNNIVRVYHKGGWIETWKPQSVLKPFSIYVNEDLIAISENSKAPVSVYNSKKELISKVNFGKRPTFIHLMPDNLLVATTGWDHKWLIIHKRNNGDSVIVSGQGVPTKPFGVPAGVCSLPDGTILVCDLKGKRISAFSPEGEFLYYMSYEGAGFEYPWAISVITPQNQPSLMAVAGDVRLGKEFFLRIYMLSNS